MLKFRVKDYRESDEIAAYIDPAEIAAVVQRCMDPSSSEITLKSGAVFFVCEHVDEVLRMADRWENGDG